MKTRLKPTVLILAALLGGCAVGPDYRRPELPLPEHYGEAAGSGDEAAATINAEWWKLFKDPVLDDLVAHALTDNADVQQAVARVEEADAVARQAGAALLPEIDANAKGQRNRMSATDAFPLGSMPAVQENLHAAIGTTFELDFWGKLRRNAEAARASYLASAFGRDTLRLSIAGLVTQAYFAQRSLEAQEALAQRTLDSRDAALAIVRARLERGLAAEIDLRQAETAQAAARAQLADTQQQRALAAHQLALLAGRMDLKLPPGDLTQLPLPPQPPAGLPSSLLQARPDVRQAEAQLAAANARIGVAKSFLFPSISLTGLVGYESQQLQGLTGAPSRIWTLGYAANLPIFDAGRLSAQVDQAQAQQKQALAAYLKAVQSAFKDVDDALVTLRQTAVKDEAQTQQAEAAQRTLQLAEARYTAGYSPYLEVLDAQRTYDDAAMSLLRLRQARLGASVDLFRALGGGWAEPKG